MGTPWDPSYDHFCVLCQPSNSQYWIFWSKWGLQIPGGISSFFSSNFPSNAVRIMSGDPLLTRVMTIFIRMSQCFSECPYKLMLWLLLWSFLQINLMNQFPQVINKIRKMKNLALCSTITFRQKVKLHFGFLESPRKTATTSSHNHETGVPWAKTSKMSWIDISAHLILKL